jgi:hypothetical protein
VPPNLPTPARAVDDPMTPRARAAAPRVGLDATMRRYFLLIVVALLFAAARQAELLIVTALPHTPTAQPVAVRFAAQPPHPPLYFVPSVRVPPPSEPECGAPAPRPLACEAWCAASPLAQFASVVSSDRQGCWQQPVATAPRLRATSQPPRLVMLYTGYNGLADSLVGAVTAFYIAALAGAEFHMRFSASANDPSFLWAFEPNCFDALNEWAGAGNMQSARAHLSFDIFHLPSDFANVVESGDVRELWGGKTVLSLNTHVGLVHKLLRNPRYAAQLAASGLNAHNAFAEAYHFLLRPRAAGLIRFRGELNALADASAVRIGIHVRAGVHYDRSFGVGAPAHGVADFAPFFDCAREVSSALAAMRVGGGALDMPRVQWFLLSDSVALRADAERHLPDTLIARAAGIDVRHSRTSTLTTPHAVNVTCASFLDAAMEHWLFGLADAHVVSKWSGFGRTGALVHVASPESKPMFQLSASQPVHSSCTLADASRIADIVEHPPGV